MGRGLVIFIVLIVIVAVLYFVFRKSPDAKVVNSAGTDPVIIPVPPCVPYTDAMRDNDMKAIRKKCSPRLLLPPGAIGIKRYANCINEGEAGLPLINNC